MQVGDNCFKEVECNFIYVCTQVICLLWYALSYCLQMACNLTVQYNVVTDLRLAYE
jgi:hypothetical protein